MQNVKESPAYKWLDNFWYHHKWKTVISVFFIIVFALSFAQCKGREVPDQTVFLFLNRNVSANQSKAIEDAISPFFDDYNGDGQIIAAIDNVSYNPQTSQMDLALANSAKVLGELGACNSILYIVDKSKFDYYMNENLLLFENLGLPDLNGYAWNWKGSAIQQSLAQYDLPEDLYFCIRRMADTTGVNEKKLKLAENAKQVLAGIVSEQGAVR